MKILCNYTPSAPSYIRGGWGRVFRALGHDFRFWQAGQESAFDVFSEYEPAIYIGASYETDRAVAKCIAKRPHMKVGLFASAWGPRVETVDLKKYPIVVVSQQERETIARLKGETGKPDFVFIHSTGQWLHDTMSGWASIGVEYKGILNAADAYVYLNGRSRPELECDVGFCGGYWGYKSRNLDGCILPLCHPSSGLRVKIFGNQHWPVHQYLGFAEDADVVDLFRSATVCPSVSEPHSTDLHFDLVERPFKILAAGGFCVSDRVGEMDDVYPGETLVQAKTHAEFVELVHHFVRNPDERLPWIERGRRHVLANHTYHHRVAQMLEGFGMHSEAARCMELLEPLVSGVSP